MLFKEIHQQMILNGTKTATRRVWKRPMVKVGGIYKCKLKRLSKDFFAEFKVTKLYKQKLGKMNDEDAKKEGYKDLKEYKEVWKRINKKIGWDKDLIVYVIEFEVVKC